MASYTREAVKKRNTTTKDIQEEEDENSDLTEGTITKITTSNEKKPKPAKAQPATKSTHVKEIKEKDDQASSPVSLWVIIPPIAVILVLCGAAYYFPHLPIHNTNVSENDIPLDIFHLKFKEFETKFPQISELSLTIINFTISSVLNLKDPRSPAAILLLGTKGEISKTNSILEELMDLLSKTFNQPIDEYSQILDFEKEDSSSISDLKLAITSKVQKNFETPTYRFMSLKNIDKAHSDVVSVLHPYFDHENAPYKKVIYLCTATTKEEMRVVTQKHFRQLAENHFDVMWEKYHLDHRDAMYSRLFNTLAVF